MLKIHRYREGLHVVTYRAILDVPRELVAYLAALLAAERRTRGTRAGTRALSCHKQAVFALVWFRERRPTPLIGRDRGISQAISYRYLTEAVDVLAAQAPDLHQALQRVADDGWSHVVGDGTVVGCDRYWIFLSFRLMTRVRWGRSAAAKSTRARLSSDQMPS